MLHNRCFTVSLNNKWNQWRSQRNGLSQGSVLTPMLFNLYTNNQPIPEDIKHFLYADYLAITAQKTTFDTVECKFKKTEIPKEN